MNVTPSNQSTNSQNLIARAAKAFHRFRQSSPRKTGMNLRRLPILVVAFLLGLFITRPLKDWIRTEPAIAPGLLSRQWVEQRLGGSGVALQVPWPLERHTRRLPAQVTPMVASYAEFSHDEDGLTISAAHVLYVPGTPLNLENAADGAIAKLRAAPGTSVKSSKGGTSILDMPAMQVEAMIERNRGVPLRMRGIFFGAGLETYIVIMVCRDDQGVGVDVWNRIRTGIHRR